jgi:hypothetical protein
MGLFSFVRDRKQVNASRAGNGVAAAASFMPDTKRGTYVGAPKRTGETLSSRPKPKRETGSSTPSSTPPRQDYTHKKPNYKENAYLTMKEKSALPSVYDERPAYAEPTKWPEGDGDRRSQIDRI